jgi:hypothetical protein
MHLDQTDRKCNSGVTLRLAIFLFFERCPTSFCTLLPNVKHSWHHEQIRNFPKKSATTCNGALPDLTLLQLRHFAHEMRFACETPMDLRLYIF